MGKNKLQGARRPKSAMPLPRAARAPSRRRTQLTDLPVEVLEQIWSEAPYSTRPISRLLLPMTQANLYRRIDLSSLGRISSLYKAVSDNSPDMAWRVRDLSLDIIQAAARGQPDIEPSAHELNQIRHLLQLLINIEDLQLRGTASLSDIVLDQKFAQDSLRRLQTLELWQRAATPLFGYSRYQHLSLYPELRRLKLESYYKLADPVPSTNAEPVTPESGDVPKVNSTITSLILRGRLSDPSVVDLVAHFDSLISLALRDITPQSNLSPLLESVKNPAELTTLEVCSIATDRFEPVDDALLRFESLETLQLSDEDTFSPATFEVLPKLPLQTIIFECSDISVDLVQDLVRQSETLMSLHLHLPFLDAEEGRTMDDWHLPRWTDLFDLEGARELQDLAIDYSVEICEQLEDALDLEDRFEEILRPKKSEVETANFPLLTATSSAPTDSLSQLPPQVIERIFAYASDLKEPISKVLLAGTNTNLYRAVRLHTYEAAERFCRTIASRPRLGRLVEELFVDFGGSDEDDSDSDAESEASSRAPAPVRANPTHDDLVRLFAALPLLKEVTIKNASRIAGVILSRTVCTRFLRNLEWIDLRESFDSFRSPWDVRAYEHLRHYPELYLLELHSPDKSVASSFILDDDDEDETEPNYELGVLKLRGNLSSTTGVTHLVTHFASIHALTLDDTSIRQDLNSILLCAPDTLSELVILQSRVPQSVLPVDAALARFPHLEELDIPDDMITPFAFETFLRDPLPLTTLHIGCPTLRDETQLSARHLLALLRPGPRKLSALESLEIEIYPGEIGSTLEDHNGVPLVDAQGECQMWPDWALPLWGPRFSLADAEKLEKAAKKAGVELSGSILDAMDVDDAYTREAKRLDQLNGLDEAGRRLFARLILFNATRAF
ncbi:hypothetical protein RQP46_007012 [Phenoliferia psychrophenolica]